MKFFKSALIFGSAGGLVIFLWFLGVYKAGYNPFFSFWANLVIIVVGLLIVLTLYIYKATHTAEAFSFGHGTWLGGITTLTLGIVSGLLIYITTTYYLPEAIEMYRSDAMQHLVKNKNLLIKESSEKIYATYLQSVPQINAYNSVQRYFTSNILIPGLMFSFLTALVLRKSATSEK